ncbi:AAA family ATPase [Desulfobulbus rhabdoformis]|uniref:ExeA family protein n=1 Tax=Desulfobulbus rhabdoformis TaxID=34032 RepID=UPI001966A6E7|nr:AAA family ATPase [Desulfobulbus rhabdoformis]MBM9613403.1 AAA family ATPase [Desulfobulbus rhabdoformis]
MYTKYYGLSKKPFSLTPDPKTVFMSETHQEGLAILKYGVLSKKCFLVLTADVGSGKTTLLQALVSSLEQDVHVSVLNNPILYRDEFFSFLSQQLGLPWDGNKALFLIEFGKMLKACHENGERVLLIFDEAHVLPVDLLEEIRLLSNLEEKGQDVLSIFLVGQPELNEIMSDDRLLPLRQRIGLRFHLSRFSLEETRQYIIFRLRQAGARHFNLFSEEAIALIHKVSQGTPRLINIICDHAMLSGFAENKPTIGPELIEESVDDLHFPGEGAPLPGAKPSSCKPWLWIIFAVFLVSGSVGAAVWWQYFK